MSWAVYPDPSAVLAAFGLSGKVRDFTPVAGGWSNRLSRLIAGEHDLAVKQIRNRWGIASWRQWLDEGWRLECAARAGGVRSPEPVVSPDGSFVAEVPLRHGPGTVHIRAHRWVAARALPTERLEPSVATWAGEALARIHGLALPPTDPSLYESRLEGVALGRWRDLVARSYAAAAPWAASLDSATHYVERAGQLVSASPAGSAVMVHDDFHQRNLLVDGSGPLLIDWDVVAPMPPEHDLARAALTLAAWREPGTARAVLDAYSAFTGRAIVVSPADLTTALALRLGWIRSRADHALARGADSGVDMCSLLEDFVHRVVVAENVRHWLGGGRLPHAGLPTR